MRTREEQIEEMVQVNSAYLCHDDYTPDNLRMMLAAAISEAEARARAECAADTRRLEWLAASLIDMRINRTRRTVIISGPMTAFDFRQSIDITQKVGK